MAGRNDEALKRIQQAKEARAKELNLRSLDLEEVPGEIGELVEVEVIHLWGNRIRRVPERIRMLKKLRRLDLRGNPVEEVPDMFGLCLDWDAFCRLKGRISQKHVVGLSISTKQPVLDSEDMERALFGMVSLSSLSISVGLLS